MMFLSGHNGSMRYLTIVRHAKATKAVDGQGDYSRALSPRGERQCQQLRAWATDPLSLGAYGPASFLVSAATRTTQTFNQAFAETDFVANSVFSELIYNGRRDVTAEDLLIDLVAIDPVTTSLAVVGHNPTVSELLWLLSGSLPGSAREGMPTGSAYVLALRDDESVGRSLYELVAEYIPD